MKLKFWILALALALTAMARAATNDLTGLLQKGLFEEEANRDLNAAISEYQSLASAFDKDRQIAATAIFRLGECYRKLGKTTEAAAQYQRIIGEFSDQQTLATLSRQNLAGLNTAPKSASPNSDDAALLDAEVAALSLQTQLEQIKKMPADQARIYVQQNFPNPVLTTLLQELDIAQQSLIKLKMDYTPDHPKYKSAQEAVNDLNAKVDAQVLGAIQSLEGKLAEAQTKLRLLQKRQNELAGTTGGGAGFPGNLQKGSKEQSDQILALRAQLEADQRRREELLKMYTPQHPQIVGVQRKINSETATLNDLMAQLQNAQASAGSEAPITDEEQKEIRRIQAMIQNSPDLINAPNQGSNYSDTPLLVAASKGQLVVAKYLLDHGADVNGLSRNHGSTPLCSAAENGHKAMVELLLARGADVSAGGLNPLYLAVSKGFTGVAQVLLANKADVNMRSGTDTSQMRPIHIAARDNRTELVQLLIKNGADVNVAAKSGYTPLELAAMMNATATAKLLVEAKAATDAKDKSGNTPLHEAARSDNTEMVSLLLDAGAAVDPINENNATPLLIAVATARLDIARVLLEHKADPNHRGLIREWRPNERSNTSDGNGQPISFAIRMSNDEMLKLLLDAGANPEGDSADTRELSPLFLAIDYKNVDSVQLLLQHGANPNRLNKDGTPPLIKVLYGSRDKRIVALLLDKGADPNANDPHALPPLFDTADPEIGRLLIEHKADVNLQLARGWTPLMNARDTNYLEFLLENGAKTDLQETNGNTALHYAAGPYESPQGVALLLEHKANPNIQNHAGNTPLDLAKAGMSGQISYTLLDPQGGGGIVPAKVSSENEQKIAELLTQAGGLDNLPKRDRIEVRRASYAGFALKRGSRDWNQTSLIESIAIAYGLLGQAPAGEWMATTSTKESSFNSRLRFPDFKHVVIYRRIANSAKQTVMNVDVESILNSADCSRDIWLEWSDVVEIPETDHPIDEQWPGLSDSYTATLSKCLTRQVTLIIKGESTTLKLAPEFTPPTKFPGDVMRTLVHASFMLRSVLDNSKLIRVSSDLSHVKVTRIDPATKKTTEWLVDCTNPQTSDLWLRDGDVIEVPEK